MATETNKIYVNDILAITIYESGMPSLDAEMNIIAENKTIKISEVYGGSLSSSASFDFAEGYSLASNGTESGLNYWIFNTPNVMSNYSGKFIITGGDVYLTASDPYNIVIKNKEGIILLTKDKTIEYTDDVKITIDESLLGGGSNGGDKYSSTIFLEFSFLDDEITAYNVYTVDENNFNMNITVYNDNDELVPSTYEFIGFERTNYSTYGYINDGMIFKINFNMTDNPSYAIINFTGVTISIGGKYGKGYTSSNVGGNIVIKSDDNFYMLNYGRFSVINATSIKYEFLTDNIYGGTYLSTFKSAQGGGADD